MNEYVNRRLYGIGTEEEYAILMNRWDQILEDMDRELEEPFAWEPSEEEIEEMYGAR